jgi:ribonuclease D
MARELAAWRERTAEREDRPVGSVLRDPSVVELAKRAPRDRGALGNIRGVTPDVQRRRGQDIIDAIERGRRAEPIRLEAEERLHTESTDGPVIALAESLVRTRAIEAGLAYELIAARADLTPIVVSVRRGTDPPPVRTLQGWRRELVGEELLALLRGERTLSVASGRVSVDSP